MYSFLFIFAFQQYTNIKSVVKYGSLYHHIRNGLPGNIVCKGTEIDLRQTSIVCGVIMLIRSLTMTRSELIKFAELILSGHD